MIRSNQDKDLEGVCAEGVVGIIRSHVSSVTS